MYCRPNKPVQSIKKTKSFKTVYNCGRQGVNAYFVMYVMDNNTGVNRLGVTVSKKVGKAVIRNRVKRLVKEICRLKAHRVCSGYDIVVVARPAAGALPREGSFKQLDKALEALFYKLRLLTIESSGEAYGKADG